MTSVSCNIFNTEYRAEFTRKKQKKIPIFVPFDCHAKRVDEKGQIDPQLASLWNLNQSETEALIKKLIAERSRSVYQVDFKDHGEYKRGLKEEFEEDSELLKYLKTLYLNEHNERILAPPATAKRVFGYASPQQLHAVLSTYQNTYGRTGARIMIKNASLIATRRRRQQYRESA